MRALILSDVHANVIALEAIARQERWDVAYCAGDLVDYGPFPVETIRWMQDHGVHTVAGNHDANVLNTTRADALRARESRDVRWAHDSALKLGDGERAYLRALPQTLCFTLDGIAYQLQHQYGDGYGTIESCAAFDAFWQGDAVGAERRMIFGHTHRRCVHRLDNAALWLNPGSVSYRRPDDADKRAHYMTIEDGKIHFHALAYDREPLLAELRRLDASGTFAPRELGVAYFFFGDSAHPPPCDG